MFTTHQQGTFQSQTTLLLLTAFILGLVATALFGATDNGQPAAPPNLLPPEAHEAAAPMNNARIEAFAADVWQAIELQNVGKWEEAAVIWSQASASAEREVWRRLGSGVTQLYQLESRSPHAVVRRKLGDPSALSHFATACPPDGQ